MSFRGAVISVGGTPEPIVKSLSDARPHFVLFVVSVGSQPAVEQNILPNLTYTPQYTCAVVPDEGDFAACYETVRNAIPIWLKERGLGTEEVYVDITGGTKPMSAGLAMAGAERFSHFSYVGGKERDKGGLGIVVSGSEQAFPTLNPWDKLAGRERVRSTLLFRDGHADEASGLLQQAAAKCTAALQEELKTWAELARLFAEADRFQFSNLAHQYGKLEGKLRLMFSHRLQWDVFERLQRLIEHWQGVAEERGTQGERVCATLVEMIANAERRAKQERYDDAVARLYRTAEVCVQGKLYGAFGCRLGRIQINQVPAQFRAKFQTEFGLLGEYQFGLKKGFNALRYSEKAEHREIAGRYDAIQGHLQKRNNSILAHGLQPAGKEDFLRFWKALLPVVDVKDEEIPRWPELEF